MPGAFKLDHLLPFEPILFWQFSQIFSFKLRFVHQSDAQVDDDLDVVTLGEVHHLDVPDEADDDFGAR